MGAQVHPVRGACSVSMVDEAAKWARETNQQILADEVYLVRRERDAARGELRLLRIKHRERGGWLAYFVGAFVGALVVVFCVVRWLS